MNKQKMKWIVPGAVVGVVALWWGLSSYVSSKAEDRLRLALTQHGLQDSVRWRKLDASLLGNVTLKDVTVDSRVYGQAKADVVRIEDLIDDPDRQRITLDVRGLTDLQPEATSFFLGGYLGAPTGKPQLPPMDARLALDLEYDDDTGSVALDIRQKDAVNISQSMTISRIGALRQLAQGGGLQGQAQQGFGLGGFGLLGALSSLSAISLNALEVEVEDRGMVARGIALFKRHNIPVTYEGGSLSSQRNKGFEAALKTWQGECEREGVMQLTRDVAKTCKVLAGFLGGDRDSVTLNMKPDTPVSVEQLTKLLFGRPGPSAAAMLKAEVS